MPWASAWQQGPWLCLVLNRDSVNIWEVSGQVTVPRLGWCHLEGIQSAGEGGAWAKGTLLLLMMVKVTLTESPVIGKPHA